MSDVREILKKRPLLFDGGMGTYYKAKPGQECEQANLLDPEGVLAVHGAYLEAGADAIKTNTFGLPRMAAAGNPLWEALTDEGWRLAAQAAAKTGAAVFADLGPAPDTESLPAAQIYTALAERFAALGAKNFLFETLSSDAGVAEAAKQIKEAVPDAFVLVSFAVLPDGYTREGRHCTQLVRSMTACSAVDAVGLNCVSAPGAMRTLVQQLGRTELPLSVMPNAGYPVVTRTRVQYQGRPEYFARELARLAAEGVRILGGCCGTTPAHIAALRTALDALPEQLPVAAAAPVPAAAKPEVETDDAFLRKLNTGKKVIAIELDSPKDADLTGYLEGARRLQAAGADLLTIADCPIARARMDSSLVACRVHRELGLNVLPHMTCRDRNLNATKALLLGLYAEGVREVLAITGDPIPTAERDEVKNVYQFNSRKLAQYIVSLAGEGREMPSPLTVFGALNLNARNFDVELRRAQEKLENGMSGFLTQPVLSAQAVENLKKTREALGSRAKILAGIMPVVSQRNAIFMENEVNGIHVDAEIIERFAGLDRAQGEELGLEVSVKAAQAAAPYADGFYLMTPFNRIALMERLIARLKEEVITD
ncbi:MAG: bifunctional homocysteine S-methyltransferase/methylenetetrahydrofolate reductase [Faecalibacterium sp.]|nr:bifunctional homocysteine S-methyltransferase/methylenetetrahydrofolate reductase [Faecalibacterium sp.]MDY5505151.1 bifunctional homocysteine S-methyltransferase/methylenetetrahydrofolate reductase [Faecalibacterium sp.]